MGAGWAELDELGRFRQVETGLIWMEQNSAKIEQAWPEGHLHWDGILEDQFIKPNSESVHKTQLNYIPKVYQLRLYGLYPSP